MISDRPTPHRDEITVKESMPKTASTISHRDEITVNESMPHTASSSSRPDKITVEESVTLVAQPSPCSLTTKQPDEEITVEESVPLVAPFPYSLTTKQPDEEITVEESVPLVAQPSPCSLTTSHPDEEITVEESVPLSAPPSPGFLARLWTAATSPFRGCFHVKEEREDLDGAMRGRAHSLRARTAALFRFESQRDAKAAAIRRLDSRSGADRDLLSNSSGISSSRSPRASEHNETIGSDDDSGHGGEEEAVADRSFLEEILEAKSRLRHVEKGLDQVTREIANRK